LIIFTPHDIIQPGGVFMGKRVNFSTKIDSDNKDNLIKLSALSRIDQTKLVDEALEDLFKKYKHLLKELEAASE
jgi:hypothetical protein